MVNIVFSDSVSKEYGTRAVAYLKSTESFQNLLTMVSDLGYHTVYIKQTDRSGPGYVELNSNTDPVIGIDFGTSYQPNGMNRFMTVEEFLYHEFAHIALGHIGNVTYAVGEQEAMRYTNDTLRTELKLSYRFEHEIFRMREGGDYLSNQCFLSDTPISLPDGTSRPIESIRPGDVVQSYDAAGRLVPGRVTRVFTNEVAHILDVHGLMVTPGHVTLCGDGMHRGRHVPIIDILLSDGALVREDGSLVRIATNAPVGSEADAMVRVLYALTPEEAGSGILYEGEMRAGTLLFDREGEPVSVLDCLRAEGLAFDPETGLVAREGQAPEPLRWFGPLPRPEDYVLRRSRETREAVLGSGEWEGVRPVALGRLQ